MNPRYRYCFFQLLSAPTNVSRFVTSTRPAPNPWGFFPEVSVSFDSESSVTYTFQEPFSVMQNRSSQASSASRESSRARENVAFSFLTSQRPAMLLSVSTFSQQYIAVILATNGTPATTTTSSLSSVAKSQLSF